MDENTNECENQTVKVKNECTPCYDSPILRGLLIALLIFLGAFCATYVVIDWHMKSMLPRDFIQDTRKLDKEMQRDIRSMNNILKDRKILAAKQIGVIRMEKGDENYKVIIDLRAFDNNENNVQVLANGNILTINGRSVRKSKHDEHISEFQQNYMFGNNVKLHDMTKETEGNNLVITIPIDNDSENDNDD
ncbi:Hsp20/alpha crystallin family protein [bacterium]|nr:Hsp20/alpha crystallin family protein [bacterium]